MADIQKPIFKDNKASLKELKKIDKNVGKLSQTNQKLNDEVKLNHKKLLDKQIEETLKSMPVDELSKAKLGIRVAALKDSGITNIYQLQGKSASVLAAIKGVGDKSAKSIVIATKQIVTSVETNTKVRISADEKTGDNDKLVKSLYALRKSRNISENAQELYSSNHKDIQKAIRLAKPASSRLRWFFATKSRRQEAINNTRTINQYLSGDYGTEAKALLSKSKNILKVEHDEYWQDFAKNAAGYYSTLENVQNKVKSKDITEQLEKSQELAIKNGLPTELAVAVEKVQPNLKGLKCELRQYQYFGVQYILNQGAVLLGDEMGLGKTVQAIATMVSLRNNGANHFMVVCPASVLINWCREIEKHSDLDVIKIHGKNSDNLALEWRSNGGVAVTTYETISKIEMPEAFKYSILVTDEAHYVKNPNANRTKALLKLREKTDRVLFMTGTPIENNVEEMCFLISCLQPKIAQLIQGSTSMAMAANFREKVAPVYFRRTKEDVLDELPEKIEEEIWCTLKEEEAKSYCASVLQRDFVSMRQVSWKLDDISLSSKAERLKSICDEAIATGRKVIVFSFFINTIDKAGQLLQNNNCFGPITGSIAPAKRQEIIDDFTNYEGGAVLLSQIQAGGTGLNIQAASIIVLCEPQLKPSIESQAIARAYRMGQINTVMVYRLLCEKSVDERIMKILDEKQDLFDNFADESVSGQESLKLDDNDFTSIIDEEINRLNNSQSA